MRSKLPQWLLRLVDGKTRESLDQTVRALATEQVTTARAHHRRAAPALQQEGLENTPADVASAALLLLLVAELAAQAQQVEEVRAVVAERARCASVGELVRMGVGWPRFVSFRRPSFIWLFMVLNGKVGLTAGGGFCSSASRRALTSAGMLSTCLSSEPKKGWQSSERPVCWSGPPPHSLPQMMQNW